MKPLSSRMVCVAIICAAGWLHGREVAAQSLDGQASSAGTTPSLYQPTPFGMPLFTPAIQNPMADPTATGSGSSSQSIFNNPLAAPLIYNSMLQASMPYGGTTTTTTTTGTSSTGTSTTTTTARTGMGMGMGPTMQLGMLMMLANQQNGGVGTGQMSGTRPTPRQSSASATDPKQRASNRPGGLAARYFNRTTPRTTYPKSYFNRKPRYFP
jgi:hypothetical protein